jgi:hypothetical protein
MMSRVLLDFGEIIVIQVYMSFSNILYNQQKDYRNRIGVEIYNGLGEKYTIAKELAHDVREIVGICKDIAQVIICNPLLYKIEINGYFIFECIF